MTPSILKVASAAIDATLRAALLEEVAGLPAGTWSRNIRRFYAEAPTQFPQADPMWFSTRSMDLYTSLMKGAMGILKSREQVEDVVGEVFSKDWIKALAKSFAQNEVMERGASGMSKANGLLYNRGKQWALDIVRSKRYRTQQQGLEVGVSDDDTYRVEPSTEWGTRFSEKDRAVALLNLMDRDTRVRDRVLALVRLEGKSRDADVLEVKVRNPSYSVYDIEDTLGFARRSGYVGQALKRVFDIIADVSASDRALANAVEVSLQAEGSSMSRMGSSSGPLVRLFEELGLV